MTVSGFGVGSWVSAMVVGTSGSLGCASGSDSGVSGVVVEKFLVSTPVAAPVDASRRRLRPVRSARSGAEAAGVRRGPPRRPVVAWARWARR